MNRKEFFRCVLRVVGKKSIELIENSGFIPNKRGKQRPPGACHEEQEFLKRCTGCDACMSACPVHAILIEDLESRHPVLDPSHRPCVHCPGYPCISSCPTGALEKDNGVKLRLI